MTGISFQEKLALLKKEAKSVHSKFLFDTEKKILDMKVSTLEYRSWTTDLYKDFCDALFFSRFEECNKDFYKVIAQSFEDLLKRFIKIEWDIISAKKLFPSPIDFNEYPINIEDKVENKAKPIQTIKKEK